MKKGKHRTSNIEHRTPNIEGRTPNIEGRTPNIEGRTPNIEGRTPNIEGRTPNIEGRTPNEMGDAAWLLREGGAAGRKFNLENRLLEFASAVIDLSERLPETRAGNHIAGQILRSGTSPFPNHGEAESAESREDFIHKLKICLKELRETRRWARLIQRKHWTQEDSTLLFVLNESDELIRIFMASIKTSLQNALVQKRRTRAAVSYPSGETD